MTIQSPLRVMFFCLGNICRSPLAEALFRYHVSKRELDPHFHIESAGTSAYHVGEPPDKGSQRVAIQRLSLDISDQRAQQLKAKHLLEFDYLIAMDDSNRQNAMRLALHNPPEILLLREFEPDNAFRGKNVPDPWGGGSDHFEHVYDIVNRCCERLLDHIISANQLA